MAKIKVCDLCGAKLDRYKDKFFTLKRNYIFGIFDHGQVCPDPAFIKLDICESCMNKILKGIEQKEEV